MSKINCCAFAVALSMALGVGSATTAADFNAGCCADLEERIAELESMTGQKGSRTVSLTISGLVNRVILHVDDGKSSQTYYGLDSSNLNTRYGFKGEARISSSAKAGFEILIRQPFAGTTGGTSQLDEDGKISSQFCASGCPSFNEHNVDTYFAAAQWVMAWIEYAEFGRLTVGRAPVAGVWGYIDLTDGQMYLVASPSFVLLNGSFFIRGPNGQYYAMAWSNIGDPAAAYGRTELVRYDTPSYKGFILSASIADAGDHWATQLRYVGEHDGLRIAGVAGYERITDIATPGIVDPANAAFTGQSPNITAWGVALSAMHNPSGLFVQGHYNAVDYGGEIIGAPSGYWGQTTQNKTPASYWLTLAGLSKTWFDYGRTSVYGEFGVTNNWGADLTNTAGTTVGRNYSAGGFTSVSGVTGTQMRVWGLGIAQDLIAANTTVYAGYRHFEADIRCTDLVTAATCSGGVGVGAAQGTFTTHKLSTEGASAIVMGSRVRF